MKANRLVYLVRPGKIQLGDDQRRYIGQIDVPLNEEGINQARNLCRRLGDVDISSVHCSDLSRSRQTAEIIASPKAIAVISHKKLREINFGKWEGRTITEIAKNYPEAFRERGTDLSYYCVPGGESYIDCSRRVVSAFHDILRSSTGNILITGHNDVNRLLLCYILGAPVKYLFRISQRHVCLNIIKCTNSRFRVELINHVGK
ncbi:histidine phosphatase family protein [Sporomusa sp. KB1]|jgi:probable phosphoglycerate mutase|uniref:histidine phosphatase family protein n=1 Tax=Sporomusa sp. KB1 TaxID=943346 RepID=UPI0011A73056|nr:histidine phosphatase family protein [Sporomusa sp. KB1]TWH51747.1 putative phosphoglycerate mutase [Sporomusa sp. KB1]